MLTDCSIYVTCFSPKRHGGGYHLLPPKSARSRRTIILPDPLVAELAEHRRRQFAERLALGER